MWTIVLLVAFIAGIAGLISIVIPLRIVGIKSRLQGLGVLCASFVAFVIASVQIPPDKNSTINDAAPSSTAAQQVAVVPTMVGPADQDRFIKIVEEARGNYQAADTDFRKGATRPARGKALCQFKSNRDVSDWIGKVTTLTTNGDGKGVVEISISDHITIKTWNNSLSDISDATLIEPGSSVFNQLGELHRGDKVKFSGGLSRSDTDCFREGSMTLQGSMTDPEFIMRFRSIQKL
ncbi:MULTISPECIES: hypothetical protein [unclassified Bradyrhizobium]|uniref:hypothetical protein n=1 Tax=unclassified Bradyrhizobium TaxID=2631580 RepID=UPI0029161F59|nr:MULTISPECIES: hypothetical protein [unclassified Bradyrhizobium]